MPSDYEIFLIWCQKCCEESSGESVVILNLGDVGDFFIEKMNNGQLDLENLALVGFSFLSEYFLSVNEKSGAVNKSVAIKKKEKVNNYASYGGWASLYGSIGYGPMPASYMDSYPPKKSVADELQDRKMPVFQLNKHPNEMEHLNIIWKIALMCQN